MRVGGKSFTIKGGRCLSGRVGFGVLGRGPHRKGFTLVLNHHNWPGRNGIDDGIIQLPGFNFANALITGTAIRSKNLESASFSIGTHGHPAGRITGTWTCPLPFLRR